MAWKFHPPEEDCLYNILKEVIRMWKNRTGNATFSFSVIVGKANSELSCSLELTMKLANDASIESAAVTDGTTRTDAVLKKKKKARKPVLKNDGILIVL